MTEAMTLADLTVRTGLDVLDHLEREVTIPVIDGMQAQGDLIVIPLDTVAQDIRMVAGARLREVPAGGVELLRGEVRTRVDSSLAPEAYRLTVSADGNSPRRSVRWGG